MTRCCPLISHAGSSLVLPCNSRSLRLGEKKIHKTKKKNQQNKTKKLLHTTALGFFSSLDTLPVASPSSSMTRNPCAGSWWGHHLLSHLSKPPGAISLTWLIAGATEEGENCSHGVNWALRESTLPAQHRDHPQPCSVRTECSHHRTQMNE